jgi:hypothetical protein
VLAQFFLWGHFKKKNSIFFRLYPSKFGFFLELIFIVCPVLAFIGLSY